MLTRQIDDEDVQDFCSQKGAESLARRIRCYWAACGHTVEVWTEEISLGTEERQAARKIWAVRSDLVNGLPNNS